MSSNIGNYVTKPMIVIYQLIRYKSNNCLFGIYIVHDGENLKLMY